MINDNEVLTTEQAAWHYSNSDSSEDVHKGIEEGFTVSAVSECFKAGAEWQKENGGINWISVDKEKPPAWKETDENTYGYSHHVLCCDKTTGRTWKDIYCHNPVNGIPYWHTGQEPTHFAYINLPE